MSVIYILAPMALLLAAAAAWAFVWSAQKGQLDDLVTPALRILNDDPVSSPKREQGQDVKASEEHHQSAV